MSGVVSRPTRRTSAGARRSAETEAAILEAARLVLVEDGYSGFTITEVARRAGAGKQTIYRWWPTKTDLFIAIYAVEKSAAISVPDLGSLEADLVAYTRDLWRFWRTDPAGRTFRALLAEAQANEAALNTLRSKFLPERLDPVKSLFARAAARQEIPVDTIEDRVQLWLGFNWFRLLTDQIDDDRALQRVVKYLV